LGFTPLPGLFTCRPRASAMASSGTSSVTTLPAATRARAPTRTGRDQGGVAADEGAFADLGAVLGGAVVVAGDGAGPMLAPAPDHRVAEVGQVVGLGALAEQRRLHLHEVADVRPRPDLRPRPQPGEGADAGAAAHHAVGQVAEGVDLGPVLHDHAGTENHVRADGHVLAEPRVPGKEHRVRRDEGGAAGHGRRAQGGLRRPFRLGQLGAAVDAAEFRFRRLLGHHRRPSARASATASVR
jgi:hypothetical protein